MDMRYLGNKENFVHEIVNLMTRCGLMKKKMIFFDAFCGTGAVSKVVAETHDVILNDNLISAATYAYGRLIGSRCSFEKLEKNPFVILNGSRNTKEGFNYLNYSPAKSCRMYFTEENAARIDYFRGQIEQWYTEDKITLDEYRYLLACLIEAVSSVSNTAGVYGAYLKHWDKRALKDITIEPIAQQDCFFLNDVTLYNKKIESIIESVQCDILYLDPPYTQNQYGTQYHLLETLILNDSPSISKVTGSRYTGPLRSDWSYDVRAHILLDELLAKTKAKHIILSYNNDGLMSKEFITSLMKIYGKEETFTFIKVPFKKYNNHKTFSGREHYEYIFYIEKKDHNPVIQSPLNYIGSKAKMVNVIREKASQITPDVFLDVFGGGFNVGINFQYKQLVYNDILTPVVSLMRMFKDIPTEKLVKEIRKIIKEHSLSANNRASYEKLRDIYNGGEKYFKNPQILYALILHGFQQQIRFNNSGEFNNPSGSRYFNDSIFAKLISFCRVIKDQNILFLNENFNDVLKKAEKGSLVYLDPPYRNTVGAYNDGKRGGTGWNIGLENQLLKLIDSLDKRGVWFIFSYIIKNKTKINKNILDWLAARSYSVQEVEETQGRYNDRKEVIISNF